jgi:UDP-N-acetylmuramyl pentapeptide phosphotransferase/UDP-N-acetylglucosamine-1-phosphate transferase
VEAESMNGGTLGLFIIITAAAISSGLIVALRPLLVRYALARPNARSSHREPTPQGGGIAVVAATLVVAALAIVGLRQPDTDPSSLGLLFAATALVALIGAIDDVRIISVAPRLMLQTLAVGLMLASLPADLRVIASLPWWFERALLLVGGVWFINLTNFMDGIDWMTVATVVPMTAALGILGFSGALPAHAAIVALALGGAIVGFAPFNRPVARLFLGDVGSLPIGLLLAWLLILLAGQGQLVAAMLLPLYYVADATITLAQRIYNRERFWEAHRRHFYQQATARGLVVLQVVGRVFAVNVTLALLALASVWAASPIVRAVALVAGAALVGGLLFSFARGRA